MAIGREIKSMWETLTTRFRWLTDKHNVYAVHASDLQAMEVELLQCSSCGRTIDIDRLGGWVKADGELRAFCIDLSCSPLKYEGIQHES